MEINYTLHFTMMDINCFRLVNNQLTVLFQSDTVNNESVQHLMKLALPGESLWKNWFSESVKQHRYFGNAEIYLSELLKYYEIYKLEVKPMVLWRCALKAADENTFKKIESIAGNMPMEMVTENFFKKILKSKSPTKRFVVERFISTVDLVSRKDYLFWLLRYDEYYDILNQNIQSVQHIKKFRKLRKWFYEACEGGAIKNASIFIQNYGGRLGLEQREDGLRLYCGTKNLDNIDQFISNVLEVEPFSMHINDWGPVIWTIACSKSNHGRLIELTTNMSPTLWNYIYECLIKKKYFDQALWIEENYRENLNSIPDQPQVDEWVYQIWVKEIYTQEIPLNNIQSRISLTSAIKCMEYLSKNIQHLFFGKKWKEFSDEYRDWILDTIFRYFVKILQTNGTMEDKQFMNHVIFQLISLIIECEHEKSFLQAVAIMKSISYELDFNSTEQHIAEEKEKFLKIVEKHSDFVKEHNIQALFSSEKELIENTLSLWMKAIWNPTNKNSRTEFETSFNQVYEKEKLVIQCLSFLNHKIIQDMKTHNIEQFRWVRKIIAKKLVKYLGSFHNKTRQSILIWLSLCSTYPGYFHFVRSAWNSNRKLMDSPISCPEEEILFKKLGTKEYGIEEDDVSDDDTNSELESESESESD